MAHLTKLGRLDQIADNLDKLFARSLPVAWMRLHQWSRCGCHGRTYREELRVIAGLLKASGRSPDLLSTAEPAIEFESARALGDVWALQELWQTLGFGELRRIFKQTRHTEHGYRP